MSLAEANMLETSAEQCRRLWLEQPILSINDCEVIKATTYKDWRTVVINCVYPVAEGRQGLLTRLDAIRREACEAALQGATIIVLSDRKAGPKWVPIR